MVRDLRRRSSASAGALTVVICLLALGTHVGVAAAQPPPAQPAPAQPAPTQPAPAQPAPAQPAPAESAAVLPVIPTGGATVDEATPAQQQAAAAANQRAQAHAQRGQHEEALVKLRESYGIVASPSTMVMIVRSLVELGKLREAYVTAVAAAPGAEEIAIYNRDFEKAAESLAADVESLRGRIGLLTVVVKGAGANASLRLGTKLLPRGLWGKEVPVLPGPTEIVLATPGGKVRQVAELAAGASATVEIVAPAPKQEPAPPPPEVPAGSSWGGPDRRMMAYIAGGVGVIGFIGVGVFGALSNGRLDLLEESCPNPYYCDPALEEHAEQGMTYQTVANVSLVVGLVGLGGGVGLWLWDFFDRGAGGESAAASRPAIAVGPGSVGVCGRF